MLLHAKYFPRKQWRRGESVRSIGDKLKRGLWKEKNLLMQVLIVLTAIMGVANIFYKLLLINWCIVFDSLWKLPGSFPEGAGAALPCSPCRGRGKGSARPYCLVQPG